MHPTTTQNEALLRRARRLLSDHRTRAKKDGAALDYDLAVLQQLLASQRRCDYCDALLTWEVSLDHRQPIARGGTHSRANLAACCQRCNRLKGQLTEKEFRELLTLLALWPDVARADVERRLLAGGSRYGGSRRRF